MKIYTKQGDQGETSLADGIRVLKNSLRVEACGNIDELNALIGVIRVYIFQEKYKEIFKYLQNILFTIGSDLATSNNKVSAIPRLQVGESEKLEQWIDDLDKDLPSLQNFILPGGNVVASYLQLARSFCRKAERSVVALNQSEKINMEIIRFLNRLSDLFFIMARYVNYAAGIKEEIWKNPSNIGQF